MTEHGKAPEPDPTLITYKDSDGATHFINPYTTVYAKLTPGEREARKPTKLTIITNAPKPDGDASGSFAIRFRGKDATNVATLLHDFAI